MPTIEDLPRNDEMDSDAMAATLGGRMKIKGAPVQVVYPKSINPVGPWNDSLTQDILDASLAESESE
ncbi:MAG: hypothetical protein ACLQO1_09410 [Steroidobacteraceae bacterium]